MSIIAEQLSGDPLTYMVVLQPIATHRLITAKKDEAGAVRAENCRTWKLTEVAPGVTKLDYVCSLDLKGFVPKTVTNLVAVPAQLNGPLDMQAYFQQLRDPSECYRGWGVCGAHACRYGGIVHRQQGRGETSCAKVCEAHGHAARLWVSPPK